MAEIVAEIMELSGVADIPPTTLPDLIVWFIKITIGIAAISGVFAVIGKFVELFSFRRW